ncbi:MAG: FAD/NAD(P)-binding protein [Candidatus Nitrosocaldus sp.]|nr:FAD/NAD(P)-binding protein [Candidatus Nitrosocaldus sp.]MDW8276334.1 FAD/NAD(P)-binding protein [Candidatus Nitrosocaldus sp.]
MHAYGGRYDVGVNAVEDRVGGMGGGVHGANPYLPRICRVRRVKRETYNTFTIDVEADGFRFMPGQFNMLYAFVGEVPISISSDPDNHEFISHTIRSVGHVTRALCSLRAGDSVGVRGPFGNPWPIKEHEGSDIVVVAGGLGLAPLRPLMYHVLANRARYGRVFLLYGTKTQRDILYRSELARWRARFDIDVHVTLSRADGRWHGNVGVVTSLIPRVHVDPMYASAFICGPEVMMRFVARELLNLGLDANRIFLSMERNMKCAVGLCGHCQFGPEFVCKDGPVLAYSRIASLLNVAEV